MSTQGFPSLRASTGPPAEARLAASILVARDGEGGLELLMLRRHGRSGFAADAWVFPGGTIDEADCALAPGRWRGVDPRALEVRFDLSAAQVLGMHVAAVRETFEEAGLLLASRRDGGTVDLTAPAVADMRAALAARDADARSFGAWLDAEDLVLDLGLLTYAFRWVTPAQEPRRYDTCFFLARAPADQVAQHDRVETTGQRWIRPGDALEEGRSGRFHMIYPTIKTLEALQAHATLADAVAWAEAQDHVRSVQPHIVTDAQGNYVEIIHPDDARYPEDPAGGAA